MNTSVLVIGLGRFGTAAALELMRLGHEVLAVDVDEARVNEIAPDVTHAVQLDASDEAALRAVGAAEFDHAIVAISGNAEASIFATMALKNLGVANVVAKAGKRAPRRDPRASRGGPGGVRRARDGSAGRPHVRDPQRGRLPRRRARFGIAKVRPPASFVGRALGSYVWSRLDAHAGRAAPRRQGDRQPASRRPDRARRRADPDRPGRRARAAARRAGPTAAASASERTLSGSSRPMTANAMSSRTRRARCPSR